MIRLFSGQFFKRFIAGYAFNRYKEVFDQAGYAIMIIDNRTNRFIKVNHAATALFGYTKEELRNMTPLDLSTEPDSTGRSLRERSDELIVRPARRKDGRIITVKIETRFSGTVSCQHDKRCHRGIPHTQSPGNE
ncbi:MAG: PAS domain S-box protein [Marinilabiliales bacterium]|nr:PAS domain S-box protein [Marinilabiliales bacterium]